MGILGRLLLLLYVLAVMVALGASAGACLHLISTPVWQNELQWIISRQETLIVLAIMFLASLCLLTMALSSKKTVVNPQSDVELQKGTFNEVKVTIPAIVGVVERAALNVVGVRQVEAKVFNQSGEVPINIKLTIILGQNYAAPEISAEVKNSVNEALKTVLQIPEVPMDIKVTEVTHAVIERERRVV